MTVSKANVKVFLLYVYSFLFVYSPTNFTPVHVMHFLFIFTLFYFISKPNPLLSFLQSKLYILSFTIFSYLTFIILFHYFSGRTADFYKIYAYFVLFLEAPICAFFIVFYMSKYIINQDSLLRFCFNVACIQLFIVFITLLIPPIRTLILETSADSNTLITISQNGGMRSFGLASGYTSDLGMTLGLFSMVSLSIALYKKHTLVKMLFLSVLFAFGAAVNARTGLVSPVIFLFFLSALFIFNIIPVIRLSLISLCAVLIFFAFAGMFDLESVLEDFGRLIDMVDELIALSQGNLTGTFKNLGLMHFFPEKNSDFWFGTGMNVFDRDGVIGSDIGYVNDIYQMGLFNLLIVLLLFFKLHSKSFRLFKAQLGYPFILALYVSLFVFYFKGVGFGSNSMTNFLIIITVGLYNLNKLDKKEYVKIESNSIL